MDKATERSQDMDREVLFDLVREFFGTLPSELSVVAETVSGDLDSAEIVLQARHCRLRALR